MRRRLQGLWLLLLFVLFFQGGCSKTPPPERPKQVINVGYIQIAECAHLYVALSQSVFSNEGLDVRLTPLRGGAEILPRVKNGGLDVGFTNVVSMVIENERAGMPGPQTLKSLGASTYENPTHLNHALLVRADSSIEKVTDLRHEGLRFAVNTRNNVEELMLRRYLVENKVMPKVFNIQPIPFPDMLAALDTRRVDVVAVVEPFIVPALSRASQYRLLAHHYEPEKRETIVATYAASTDWINKHQDTAQALVRALTAASKFMQENDAATRKIIADFTRISATDVQSMGLPLFTDELRRSSYLELIDDMQQFGMITKPLAYDESILRH